jgi:hypothetical protein
MLHALLPVFLLGAVCMLAPLFSQAGRAVTMQGGWCQVDLSYPLALQVLGTEPRLYQVTLPAAGSSRTLTLGTAAAPIKWA